MKRSSNTALWLLACALGPAVAAPPAVAVDAAAGAASAVTVQEKVSPYALAARRQAQAQAQAHASDGVRVSPLTQHRPRAPANRGLQR